MFGDIFGAGPGGMLGVVLGEMVGSIPFGIIEI
jgi:hypothetical protein